MGRCSEEIREEGLRKLSRWRRQGEKQAKMQGCKEHCLKEEKK